jgi:hypothetical protein
MPDCAEGKLEDMILSAGAATVSDISAVAVCAGDALSDTVTAKLAKPALAGVPDNTPDAESSMPGGRFPDVTDQEYLGSPPVARSAAL